MSGSLTTAGGADLVPPLPPPYTVTGGRPRPAHDDLELETVTGTSEHEDVCDVPKNLRLPALAQPPQLPAPRHA
jgi:hypothetical protein